MDESQVEQVVEAHRANCELLIILQSAFVAEAYDFAVVPSAVSGDLKHSERAVQALSLIGGIALHRYQAIDPA